VLARAAGPRTASFRGFVLEPQGVFAMRGPGSDREATERLLTLTRVITESPALLAREREVLGRYTDTLAALVAEETGAGPDDVEPWVVAQALLGVHRALIDYVRRRVLAGATVPEIAEGLREQAQVALARLESGLGDYDVKR
jgi:hypothetical protein